MTEFCNMDQILQGKLGPKDYFLLQKTVLGPFLPPDQIFRDKSPPTAVEQWPLILQIFLFRLLSSLKISNLVSMQSYSKILTLLEMC